MQGHLNPEMIVFRVQTTVLPAFTIDIAVFAIWNISWINTRDARSAKKAVYFAQMDRHASNVTLDIT